ncbi:hypothetical protein SAY87_003409 [Trapa incisa]|uniref:Protein kinase domain-containing protein n=1 Tax=Trapa incisa TaxID=236973 RepID=A0AAN7KFQ7_9MYRT|nr:hypothetical protein SAY87_003409 [Trapa incisa]
MAKDMLTGKLVALKKVRFDNLEPESIKFMAREILILWRLDHPNVVKLEGLVTSRMFYSLYLVFPYIEHYLAGLATSPDIKFTESQVKCYIHQLLSGLEHCHNWHVLHRVIKVSNLLIDNDGVIKIADFGLASIYKLCNSPSDEYWRKYKLPNATLFKPREPYKRCIKVTFKNFPSPSLHLIETLLAIDPIERLTVTAALQGELLSLPSSNKAPHDCGKIYGNYYKQQRQHRYSSLLTPETPIPCKEE